MVSLAPLDLADGHLTLTPEEFRRVGRRIIDHIAARAQALASQPVVSVPTPDELARRLPDGLPRNGTPLDIVLNDVFRDVLSGVAHADHPRFFAFVPGPSNPVGILADLLASAFNVDASMWLTAAGPTAVELQTIDWLLQIIGFPQTGGGLFLSGGSQANLAALAVARANRSCDRPDGDHCLYYSDQTHSSVERGARLLAFRTDRLRRLRTRPDGTLDPAVVRAAIEEDRRRGDAPLVVVANAGTTNTGAVDPLGDLADLCAEYGIWLHVDAAFGAAAMLVEEGRGLLAGLERADSVTVDPHKWLFQPFELGGLLVRRRDTLTACFRTRAEYLEDARAPSGAVDFCDRGIQLTRGFRALKLWMSLRVYGADAFGAAITCGMELAALAESELRSAGCWDITSPAQLGIVTFRYRTDDPDPAAGDAVIDEIVDCMQDDGFAFVRSTRFAGRKVLRLCTINPRTTDGDVIETVRRMTHFARGGAEGS